VTLNDTAPIQTDGSGEGSRQDQFMEKQQGQGHMVSSTVRTWGPQQHGTNQVVNGGEGPGSRPHGRQQKHLPSAWYI